MRLQIRQNTNQVKVASYQQAISFVEFVNNLGVGPQAANLVRRGFQDFQALSDDEKVQIDGMLSNVPTRFVVARQLYLQGTLSVQEFTGIEMFFARVFRSPGVAEWWALTKHTFPPEYQDMFDDVIGRYPNVEPWSEHFKFARKDE